MNQISWRSFLPWRWILRSAARQHGFIDPLDLYTRLQRFAVPSEVAEPIELLRAGVVFHARGLINSRVIQHNLDWVWPYWINRQFNPADPSFLPRAFSLTHVNLTHRNWTALGLPGYAHFPIVDPRGLLTPTWDSWSVECWLLSDSGKELLPSRQQACEQKQLMEDELTVVSRHSAEGMSLDVEVTVMAENGQPYCLFQPEARIEGGGWLVAVVRPYNPEGVSFIDEVALSRDRLGWRINGEQALRFSEAVERHHSSEYKHGDVYRHLRDAQESESAQCRVGMASAAAMFRVPSNQSRRIVLSIEQPPRQTDESGASWCNALDSRARLDIPDSRWMMLFDAAIHTLVLCSPADAYAGPYTYKRYWYRDAVFVAHGLLSAGLIKRAEALASRFTERQDRSGYFHSQQGEWDSNGQVLWMIWRLRQCSNTPVDGALYNSAIAAADWIGRKLTPSDSSSAAAGLLPAGFSAEHLGPNDHYYWDNFWAVAGLESAAQLALDAGDRDRQQRYLRESQSLRQTINASLDAQEVILGHPAMPAAPGRRLDAGSIGSLVAGYPPQLFDVHDARLLGTLNYLYEYCFYDGGFFQDMIHAGVNVYLTLHIAQVMLRAGDRRYLDLMDTAARLASPTGHWPEAVHPRTGGGCMGDGQHAWAAAEWAAMIRNCFVREEQDTLVLASGVPKRWFAKGGTAHFGPTPTSFGAVTVSIARLDVSGDRCRVAWQTDWFDVAPPVHICLPGYRSVVADDNADEVVVSRFDLVYPSETS